MCLGGHSYNDLREKMKEERHNSPTTNRQGGTDIDLLHISGSSGEGVSTVIIFIVTVLLLSLAGVALWFLWRCIRDCSAGSDDERDARPASTRRSSAAFSTSRTENFSESRSSKRGSSSRQSVSKWTRPEYSKCSSGRQLHRTIHPKPRDVAGRPTKTLTATPR